MTQIAIPSPSRNGTLQQPLSAADLAGYKQAFADDGYVIFKNVVSRERLADLQMQVRNEFDRARQTGALFSGGGTLSGHLNCFPGEAARFAYDALEQHGIIDFMRSISSTPLGMPNVGCNFNMPGSVTQHYHMDRTFTNEFLIANIAVVDTDLVNGAIDVIPGTHRTFYKFWRFALERPYRNHKRLTANAGDVLVRVSNLWHRGMPNHSSAPRPMLAFSWEDGGSSHADPFAVEGGKILFRPNWFRPSRLGRLRERIFVTAPITYSAYRFVDSLVSNKSY